MHNNCNQANTVKVMYEVLTVVANDAPHRYLHNGVGIHDVEEMARVFYKTLLNANNGKPRFCEPMNHN